MFILILYLKKKNQNDPFISFEVTPLMILKLTTRNCHVSFFSFIFLLFFSLLPSPSSSWFFTRQHRLWGRPSRFHIWIRSRSRGRNWESYTGALQQIRGCRRGRTWRQCAEALQWRRVYQRQERSWRRCA